MILRRSPAHKSPPKLAGTGGGRRTNRRILARLKAAYEVLHVLARDPREPAVRRSLARAAGVLVHRLTLLITTGADADAELYLADTLDVASRTSRALLDAEQEAAR